LTWEIRKYEVLDSTNLEARRLLGAGAHADRLAVWALHQTQGRGRLHRDWYDLPGKSLLVSVAVPAVQGFAAGVLVATSMRAAVVKSGGTGPGLKWPNDLVYGDRKVGGILSETFREQGISGIIAGIGLNVGYKAGELSIASRLPATSLLIEEGREWEPEQLLKGFLEEMEGALRRDWEDSLAEYRRNLSYVGEWVRVGEDYSLLGQPASSGKLQGVLEGVDDCGRLLLRVENRMLVLVSGEITPADWRSSPNNTM